MRRKTQAAMQQAQSRRTHMRQLCKRIAQEFKPEKIILFGSHAYGQPTPESDLDLLVVMQFDGDPPGDGRQFHARHRRAGQGDV